MLWALVAAVLLTATTGAQSAQAANPAFNPTAGAAIDNGTVARALAYNTTGSAWTTAPGATTSTVTSLQQAIVTRTGATAVAATTTQVAAATEVGALTTGAGATAGVGALGTVALGAATFYVGWQIGSGIRTIYSKYISPAAPVEPNGSGTQTFIVSIQNHTARFFPAGSFVKLAGGPASHWGYAHQDMWILTRDVTMDPWGTSAWDGNQTSGEEIQTHLCQTPVPGSMEGCDGSVTTGMVPLPEGFRAATGPSSYGTGASSFGCPCNNWRGTDAVVYWAPARTWPKRTGTSDYVAQPVDRTTTDDSPRDWNTIAANITNDLNNNPDKYPELVDIINDWAEPEAEPDPEPEPEPDPINVLAPGAHEAYPEYLARLRAAGFTGTITAADATGSQLDPARAPGEVVTTDPAPGTPVAPSTTIVVYRNPAAETDPTTEPAAGENVSQFNPPSIPALNLGPLADAGTSLVDRFPFGVPAWVGGALGGLTITGNGADCPPESHIDAGPLGGDGIPITWCKVEPMVTVVRPVILFASLLGLAWFFMGAALGFGGGSNNDD